MLERRQDRARRPVVRAQSSAKRLQNDRAARSPRQPVISSSSSARAGSEARAASTSARRRASRPASSNEVIHLLNPAAAPSAPRRAAPAIYIWGTSIGPRRSALTRGRVALNVLPSPGRLLTLTVPPIVSTRRRVTGRPKPLASSPGCSGRAGRVGRGEDVADDVRIDADSGVVDGDLERVLARPLDPHPHPPPGRRELERVREEVGHHLPDPTGVGERLAELAVGLQRERDPPLERERVEAVDDLDRERRDADALGPQLEPAGLDPRDVERLVEQIEHVPGARGDVRCPAPLGRRERLELVAPHHLGEHRDRRQRRPHLVGERRDEPALGLGRVLRGGAALAELHVGAVDPARHRAAGG